MIVNYTLHDPHKFSKYLKTSPYIFSFHVTPIAVQWIHQEIL